MKSLRVLPEVLQYNSSTIHSEGEMRVIYGVDH
jgi:hypothetical protein